MVGIRVVCPLVFSTLFAGSPATASISSTMIVEMREITSVSVSPSGQLAVVGICHANPRTNKRELSWVVVPLREGGTLKEVPAGEEIYDPSAPGALLSRQALWSSDSKWFFYLRRDGEEVQLWETRADGRATRQVTRSKSDLIDLKRSSEANVFIVQLAPDREALRRAEQDENRNGILYDDHVIGEFPLTRTLPVIDRWRSVRRTDNGEYVPPGWSGRTTAFFDVRSHNLRAADGLAPKTLAPAGENGTNTVSIVALNPMPKNQSYYVGQYTLELEPKTAEDPKLKCALAECVANRITIIGWSPDGAEVYYLADSLQDPRGIGFSGGAAIYAWNPHRNVVRLIHESGEGLWGRLYNLHGIAGLSLEPNPVAGREIVVAFAGADEPPRLEAINLDTGVSRILFDPNAELRSLTQGRALWHTWETSTGYLGRGIMILPDDYRPGKTYPAVITTYACGNGFLRGGSGDNASEYVLAKHGFIAVCVNVPVSEILMRETDKSRIYPVYCDIILGLIADLTKSGKLDPSRVGLSGQSLGANAGAYCISHSNSLAAAAFRHGSYPELARWELFDTSAAARGPSGVYARLGLPDPRNDPTGKWDRMSVSHHAANINAPTLLELDDLEHLGALPLWSAMRDEGKAVEMYVFPEDTHLLIQPIHMLVNFERQLDWFRFWLKNEEDVTVDKPAQYERWNRLREMTSSSRPQH